jgi:hypothetical protein
MEVALVCNPELCNPEPVDEEVRRDGERGS